MADWRDGAEYAPTERPFGFATPRVAPLSAPAEPPSPAVGQPPVAPNDFTAPNAAPLATLAPRIEQARDPNRAFDTDSSTFTGQTAWGTVAHGSGGWTPSQPFALTSSTGANLAEQSAPRPGSSFAPPTGGPVVPATGYPAPVGVPSSQLPPGAWAPPAPSQQPASSPMLDWLVFLCLLAGFLVRPISIVLIVAAWLIARQLKPVARSIRRTLSIGLGVAVVLGGLAALNAQPGDGYSEFSSTVLLVSLVLTITVGIQLLARRRSR